MSNESEVRGLVVVVVVDDDALVLSSLKRLLQNEWGEVLTFSTPTEAVTWVAAGGEPWVVISDQSMPEVQGVELLEFMQAWAPRAFLILHTGELRVTLKLPMNSVMTVVTKPIEPSKLRALVLDLLRVRALSE